jgi:serine/threonine protein phosphatase PrpC
MIQRINGSLAVSRALGDFEYKMEPQLSATEQLVSPEPEVSCLRRENGDEFLLLACDGVWDVMSNDEVIGFIRAKMLISDDLVFVCNELMDTCLAKVSPICISLSKTLKSSFISHV